LNAANQGRSVSLSLMFFYAGTLIISLTTFRPVAPFFNGSDTLYLISIVLIVIQLLYEGRNLSHVFIRNNPAFKPLMIFLLGAILSFVNSQDLTAASTVVGKYIFLFGLWLPAGIYLLNTPRRIYGMLVVLVAAALLPLIPAIGDYYFQTRITAYMDRLLALNLEHTSPLSGRFGSIMVHPNIFGIMIVVIYPVAMWLLFAGRTISARICGLLFICLLLTGSLITASRTTAVAISIQSVFFIVFMPNRSHKQKAASLIVMFALICSVIAVALKAKPVLIVDRFIDMTSYQLGEYQPDSGRVEFVIEALQAIMDHPVAGLGVENAASSMEGIGVHNTILRLWAGIGAWGLIFICWVYLLAFRVALSNFLRAKYLKAQQFADISFLGLVSLIGWFLADMVQPQFYDRYKFITLILMFALSKIIESRISKPSEKVRLQQSYGV
jgi:hypothetical protein